MLIGRETHTKLKTFHRSPEFRTISPTCRPGSISTVYSVQPSSWVKMIAYEQVLQSFRHLVNSTMPHAQVQSATRAPTIVAPTIVSSTHQFDAPVRRLVPTFTDISSSLAPLYIETAMFALPAQQRITNWDSRSAYVFNNATRYLSLVQLHTTASRPFQLHEQLLFLQSGEHPFTPDDPWDTLFAQRHYQYRVAQISNDVLHCDFVELFYAPAQTELLASDIVLKMRCTYTGTYFLQRSTAISLRSTSTSSVVGTVINVSRGTEPFTSQSSGRQAHNISDGRQAPLYSQAVGKHH